MTDDPTRVREGAQYAERWIEFQRALKDIPGVALAIRHRDKLVSSVAFGWANVEHQIPLTTDHVFRIASHSKTFTATAVMLLAERGKLRLDDCAADHLAWLPGELRGVTVRQLLNHSSGIVRDGADASFWPLQRDFPDAAGLRESVQEILPPNDRFKYSNVGYSLLGAIVEEATGEPYNDYVRREIVDRLGLRNTGPETNEAIQERLVTGYTNRAVPFPRIPLPDADTHAMSAATGFYSTAEDLTRYATAHFMGNEELLTDASKREMQQPYWEVAQQDHRYGLGFAVLELGSRRLVGHGGSFPGHSTHTWIDPKGHLAVSVLTSESQGPAALLAQSAVKIIDLALEARDVQPTVDLDRYAGNFINLWGPTDIVRFGGELFDLDPSLDNPAKWMARLEPIDANTLRIADAGGYGSVGESIRYVRDAANNVERIIYGGVPSVPMERADPDLERHRR